MSKITTWSKDTIPPKLVEDVLAFYRAQDAFDHNFKGTDLRGTPPQPEDLPQLYDFIESLGYEVDYSVRTSGNYLETASNYPIHADTEKGDRSRLDYTIFLLPLYVPPKTHSYLFMLDQKWVGEAATLTRQPWPKGWNELVTDYDDGRLQAKDDDWDFRLISLGVKFTPDTLKGMSIDTIYRWRVGSMIAFPCNQLHFSITNSPIKKIGLSLRLVCKNAPADGFGLESSKLDG